MCAGDQTGSSEKGFIPYSVCNTDFIVGRAVISQKEIQAVYQQRQKRVLCGREIFHYSGRTDKTVLSSLSPSLHAACKKAQRCEYQSGITGCTGHKQTQSEHEVFLLKKNRSDTVFSVREAADIPCQKKHHHKTVQASPACLSSSVKSPAHAETRARAGGKRICGKP